MKLAEPINFLGEEITEIKLPPKMKVKYIKHINPRIFSEGGAKIEDMMLTVDGIFQLRSGTAGEMGLSDLVDAFNEAVGFLSGPESETSSSDSGELPSSG